MKRRARGLVVPPVLLAVVLIIAALLPEEMPAPPPNAPAQIKIDGSTIEVFYHGAKIFSGAVENSQDLRRLTTDSYKVGEAVHQVVALNARTWERPVRLRGAIRASSESFPCESERDPRRPAVVRHSSGQSQSLLNQAVYDRKWDWVLSVDDQPRTRTVIRPASENRGKGQSESGHAFSIQSQGYEIILRFRPRFYQQHRGLKYFEPWTYRVWDKPVVGWCSWFAFFDGIREEDIVRTADVTAGALAPFGYEYLQMDDGFQRGNGLPDLWLKPNEKFPRGLEYLANYIKSKGLKPAIWTNVTFAQSDFAEKHRNWFVLDPQGRVASGNWIDHALDASVPEALESIVRPIYRGLREQGWEYFKVDGLRHLRYEGYNANADYFRRKGIDLVGTYRTYVRAVRDEIGRDKFMLGCWGVRPELAGIIDGCRLGTDGFSYAGLAQYNSFNNVVWRNDPDHVVLSPAEAYRSTMVTSLTGSLLLLTDKPEVYRTGIVEPARRAAPVLFTLPGQVYDVDPSRSQYLGRVDAEVSGKEPKVFDAGLVPACHLYLLEVCRPFEDWVVLGRTGGEDGFIRFEDLGLAAQREYYVFEFWSKNLVGSFSRGFPAGKIDPAFNSQVFCIRERRTHPQILATSRHITGGGVDLVDVTWEGRILSGRSRVVEGDVYDLYVSEPEGFVYKKAACSDGAEMFKAERIGGTLRVSLRPDKSGEVSWSVSFVVS